jgi:integrase
MPDLCLNFSELRCGRGLCDTGQRPQLHRRTIMAKEPAKRERGLGRVYLPRDPQHPGRTLQTWWLDYSIEGRRYRESSKSRKRTAAVALLKQRLGQAPEAAAARATRVTFEDLKTGIEADYKRRGNRSWDRVRQAFIHLEAAFGGWDARRITAESLTKYADERCRVAKPATVKYELTMLRRSMKGRLNPRPDFPSIEVQNARVGFFEQEEYDAIVQELPEPLGRIAAVALFSGWRKSEILGLTWAQIDFTHEVMRLEPTSTLAGTSTKNDDGRVFPFAGLPQLGDVLREQRAYVEEVQRRVGAVFPWVWVRGDGRRVCKIDVAWNGARKRAGYPGRLFHDFRRTAVRDLLRAGVPEHWAMQLTGHKSTQVFRRYAITSESDLAQAVAKLAALHGAAPKVARSSLPLKTAEERRPGA